MSSSGRHELEASFAIRLSPNLRAQIHKIIEEYVDEKLEEIVKKCVNECLEEVVKKCLEEKKSSEKVLELRKIPRDSAVVLIKKYVDEHQGCRTSDIIYDLALDSELVLSILQELEERKQIRGE